MAEEPQIDIDPSETREWLEALDDVLEHDGAGRVRFLLEALSARAAERGAGDLAVVPTPYRNSLPAAAEPPFPGDLALEERLQSIVRWNAMAMVSRANTVLEGIGGHIATYQSASTLFEVGFNHFWRAPGDGGGGDLVYFQGHASPGVYARAFLEGRLTQEHLERFRQETAGGLSSYPHPRLMPELWQFATVSMGLGPLSAIYQARFLRYLEKRRLLQPSDRHVWAFLGDGEMDEPESQGALTVAGREALDNLIFVVNCNLQRLDGPVRGNGKIVDELELLFRGAGWRVIKLLWGSGWDELLARDESGALRRRLDRMVDGELQLYAKKVGEGDARWIRETLFDSDELRALVAHLSDDELLALRRGGHDPQKVYAAYKAAVLERGRPVAILAQTVKGWGMGGAGEGLNGAHSAKKLKPEQLRAFRDRLGLQGLIPDDQVRRQPYLKPPEDSAEILYLKQRRQALGGFLPQRRAEVPPLAVPPLERFGALLKDSGKRTPSTTQSFVAFLRVLLRDEAVGPRVVPIIADEARTFGMEGLFKQFGIYSPWGQRYEPVDAGELMEYREAEDGQILQEGITEAGSIASWTAAGTAYANHGLAMVPFFIFYSMFGFQRVGDFIWAAADQRARGFLIGATSGRTTLNGEGLQHEDGHSHLIASTVPSCVAYDPTYGYELAVIFHHGLERMLVQQEDVFYYVTTLNENYPHRGMPEGAEEGIKKGLYRLFRSPKRGRKKRVQLLGSGAILREVEAAAALLEADHGVAADVWSATSWSELRRDGIAAERWARLHPEAPPRRTWVDHCLGETDGPIVAASDYMRAVADQIRPFVPRPYYVLGTDGYGRSDTRERLRRFFEVDRYHVVVAALKALADQGAVEPADVAAAIQKYAEHGVDPDAPDPWTV